MFVAPSRKNFSGMGADGDQDLENHDIAQILHLPVTGSNHVGPFHWGVIYRGHFHLPR